MIRRYADKLGLGRDPLPSDIDALIDSYHQEALKGVQVIGKLWTPQQVTDTLMLRNGIQLSPADNARADLQL